jgi:hypothetical protein
MDNYSNGSLILGRDGKYYLVFCGFDYIWEVYQIETLIDIY